MSWITPVTNRADKNTKTTHTDMNRIAGNINFLLQTSNKADYVGTDIVTLAEWTAIIDGAEILAESLSMDDPTSETTWTNLNYIETLCKKFYEEALYPRTDLYPLENLYPMKEE